MNDEATERARVMEAVAAMDDPIIRLPLWCPFCRSPHIDEGEWETRQHRTHQCQECGREWRIEGAPTCGVAVEPDLVAADCGHFESCPFCGSDDLETYSKSAVVCNGCHAHGPISASPVTKWNERPLQSHYDRPRQLAKIDAKVRNE